MQLVLDSKGSFSALVETYEPLENLFVLPNTVELIELKIFNQLVASIG